MNIGIIGYGRMGKEVASIAEERGHNIVCKITPENQDNLARLIKPAEVAIDFSSPESAYDLCLETLKAGIPVVSGTTGWNDKIPDLEKQVWSLNGTFLHASNFSLGVNIFFYLNQQLAKIMNDHPAYSSRLEETHHVHKKDAPSGTAIQLAEDIVDKIDRYSKWELNPVAEEQKGHLPVKSHRKDEVPGIHEVSYKSRMDQITLRHEAFSRKGFALGAVLAAEFAASRQGIFTMSDVLGLRK